jgi:hypothetical protein
LKLIELETCFTKRYEYSVRCCDESPKKEDDNKRGESAGVGWLFRVLHVLIMANVNSRAQNTAFSEAKNIFIAGPNRAEPGCPPGQT